MKSPTALDLHPLSEHQRIASVDVVRGVAVLGILLLNIVGMSMPEPAYNNPSGWGGDTGWNLRVWWANSLCFEGTMRTLFSLLFGAGVLLFTGKGDEKQSGVSIADAWYRRTIWLFLFGLLNGYLLLWSGDILYAYGLLGMFLFPFRHVRPARLGLLASALLAVGFGLGVRDYVVARDLARDAATAAAHVQRGEAIPAALQNAQKDWEAKRDEIVPPKEAREAYVAAMQGGYARAFIQRAHSVFLGESFFHVRYNYFDVLPVMFLGMALLRWRVLQAGRATGTYVAMIVLGYGLGLPVNWWEGTTYAASHFEVVTFFRTLITYDIGRLAVAAGHLGVILLLCRLDWMRWLRHALAATGRMALTNYLTHSVVTAVVFVGFAQFGRWERHELYYLVAGIWCFQLVASPLWLRRFQFGPVEWLWRRLTYLQRQPFRRSPPPLTASPEPSSSVYGLPASLT